MAYWYATKNQDNYVGTAGDDDIVTQYSKGDPLYPEKNVINAGDVYDGGAGHDILWVTLTMVGITFPANDFDYSVVTLKNIEQLNFNYMVMPMAGQVIFKSDQFGPGLLSNNLEIVGTWNSNDIVVNLVDGDSTFDASGWTFPEFMGQTKNPATSYTDPVTGLRYGNATGVWGQYIYQWPDGGVYNGKEVGLMQDTLGSFPAITYYRKPDDTIRLYGSAGNNVITGSIQADHLFGKGGNDTLYGGLGNDVLYGGAGNDSIDGGAGVNKLLLSGLATDYTINDLGGGVLQVIDNRANSPDGTDLVKNVSQANFVYEDDGSYFVALKANITNVAGDNWINSTEKSKATLVGNYDGLNADGYGKASATVSYKVVGHDSVSGSGKVKKGPYGEYSLKLSPAQLKSLADGDYTMEVTVADAHPVDPLKPSVTITQTFKIDSAAPTFTSISGAPTGTTKSINETIAWTAADGTGSGVDHYKYSTDGGKTWVETTNTSLTLTNLANGAQSFKLQAFDLAGNGSVVETRSWTVARPVITSAKVVGGDWKLTGTSAKGSTLVKIFDGAVQIGTATPSASGAWSFQTALDNTAIRKFTVIANDSAGPSAPSLAFVEGASGNDVLVFSSPGDLGASFFGNGGVDTVSMSAPTVVDTDFAKISKVQTLQLAGAADVTLGAKATAAGIKTVVVGSGDTTIESSGKSLAVDGGALAAPQLLKLEGKAAYTVTNLQGNLDATALVKNAVNVTAGVGSLEIETGAAVDTIKSTFGGNTITAGGGGDKIDITGHTTYEYFVYTATTDSLNRAKAFDTITGATVDDQFDFSAIGALDAVGGQLADKTAMVGSGAVAWIYDATSNHTFIYANATAGDLKQTSTSLMKIDLVGNVALSGANFAFA